MYSVTHIKVCLFGMDVPDGRQVSWWVWGRLRGQNHSAVDDGSRCWAHKCCDGSRGRGSCGVNSQPAHDWLFTQMAAWTVWPPPGHTFSMGSCLFILHCWCANVLHLRSERGSWCCQLQQQHMKGKGRNLAFGKCLSQVSGMRMWAAPLKHWPNPTCGVLHGVIEVKTIWLRSVRRPCCQKFGQELSFNMNPE